MVMVAAAMALMFVILLLAFQFYYVIVNKTQYELFSSSEIYYLDERAGNPFSSGCMENIKKVFIKRNGLIDWNKMYYLQTTKNRIDDSTITLQP